jgi:hypothetical protein
LTPSRNVSGIPSFNNETEDVLHSWTADIKHNINRREKEPMFGFSTADWIFIAVVCGIIFTCVFLSGMNKQKN